MLSARTLVVLSVAVIVFQGSGINLARAQGNESWMRVNIVQVKPEKIRIKSQTKIKAKPMNGMINTRIPDEIVVGVSMLASGHLFQ